MAVAWGKKAFLLKMEQLLFTFTLLGLQRQNVHTKDHPLLLTFFTVEDLTANFIFFSTALIVSF